MAKRLFDLIAATLGLLVLFPLLVVIAVWIKLDSPGPVFFRQVRVGRFGKPFRIFKFRTMRTDSERGGRLTVGQDNRITRSGHFLRRYKLDELPQLIDVLRGTMSLVGPRPEVPEFVKYYPPDVKDRVLSVRPGITDEASIAMVDENELLSRYDDPRQAYIDQVLPQKLSWYLDYVTNPSMIRDVRILFKTVQKILWRG